MVGNPMSVPGLFSPLFGGQHRRQIVDDHTHHHHPHAEAPGATVTDPVCGMKVNPDASKHRFEHADTTYAFCGAGCGSEFEADPSKYLAPKAPEPPVNADATYTCPMHPEIRQQGPGSCPICGMALEPLVVTAEAAPNHELADMTRRFWIGLVLTLPVFVLAMGG